MPRKPFSIIIIFCSFILFSQCGRNSLYRNTNDPLSLVGISLSSISANVQQLTLQAEGIHYANAETYSFGTVTVGGSSPDVVFTIQNNGTDDVTLSGTPVVAVSGDDAADFTAADMGPTVLAPGGSADFTVRFAPGVEGARDGVIRVMSNDGNQTVYTLNLTGTGSLTPVPGINVPVGTTYYGAGSTFVFSAVPQGGSSGAVTFTIENSGIADLNLGGVTVSGPNASDFTVTGPTATGVASGESATFTVTFTPSTTGTETAVITIVSNDPDVPSLTITITGTGTVPLIPDVSLRAGATDCPQGFTFDYGTVETGTPVTTTFTIENAGNANLDLTNVITTGGNSGDFVVNGPGVASVPLLDSADFDVTFTPGGPGARTTTLMIESNDPDENPYTITLNGTGVVIPHLTSVSISSNNINPAYATVGNIVTLSFTADMPIQAPTVTIAGGATVLSGGPTAWTATYTMLAGDGEGTVSFAITNISDLIANSGPDVFATTDGSNVRYDRTAPAGYSVSIVPAYINSTNTAAFSFSFTSAEVGARYDYSVTDGTGTVTGSGTVAASGETITGINVTGLGDGALTLSVTLTDAAGNTGAAAADTVTKDTVLPTVIITMAPAINAANATSYTVSGTCSDNGQMVIVSINGADTLGPPCIGTSFSATGMNVSTQPEGTVTVAARQSDAAGNTGTDSRTVAKDTVAPTVAIGAPSPVIVNGSGSANYVITYSGADTVNLTNGNVTVQTVSGTAGCSTVTVTGGTTLTPTVAISGCTGNGTVRLFAIAAGRSSDAAGNSDAGAGPGTAFSVDTAGPTASIAQDAGQADPTNALPVTFVVNFNEAVTGFTAGDIIQSGTATGVAWNLSTSNNIMWILTATAVGSAGTVIPTFPASAAADLAGNGNVAPSAGDNSVMYDITPPAVAITTNGGADFTTNVSTQTLSGNCGTDATMSANVGAFSDSNCADGDWTLNAPLASEGANTITVTATDPLMNAANDSIIVTRDTVPPAVAITAPGGGADFTTNMLTQTISGTCSSDATMSTGSPGTLTDNCGVSGSWTLANISLVEGGNAITLTATDPVSNIANDVINITRDTTPPTVIITTNSGADFTTNVPAQTISGTCGADATMSANTGAFSDDNCLDGNWSLDVSLPVEGANTITVTATDAMLNAANDSIIITRDMTPPALSIGAPSATDVNSAGIINYVITYTGANTVDLTNADVTLQTTGTASCSYNVLNGNTAAPTVSVYSCSGNGTVRIASISANTAWDAIGNYSAAAGPSVACNVDNAAPTISTAVTQDSDNDGRIDRYLVTFDGPVRDSTFTLASWTVAGHTITGWDTGSANDNQISLILTEMTFPDTGAMPDVTTTVAGAVQDMVGNSLGLIGTGDVMEQDGAPPRFDSVVGAVGSNMVTVTFTEPVHFTDTTGCSGTLTSWGFTPGGGAVASISPYEGNACDDAKITFQTNVNMVNGDIDSAQISINPFYDSARNNHTDSSDQYIRGLTESINFRFDTTSNGANVANSVSNFPVILRIKNTDIRSKIRSDCGDIMFVDRVADGGAVLPYEIERCDGANLDVWVLVPTVSGNSNTDYITMYFNEKTDGTVPGRNEPGKVFSIGSGDSFAGVWHMSNGTQMLDSTVNRNNSSSMTSSWVTSTNYMGYAQMFNGTSQYIEIPHSDSLNGTGSGGVTVSAWVRHDNTTSATRKIVSKKNAGSSTEGYELYTNPSTRYIDFIAGGTTNFQVRPSSMNIYEWHHIVSYMLNDGTKWTYFDGVLQSLTSATTTDPITAGTYPLVFGKTSNSADGYFYGQIDEVRIENTWRGDDWVKLCYENQRINQTFVSAWYNSSWNNRIKISVNESLVIPTGLGNFPVYVNLANLPTGFFSNVHYANGDDILVTAGDGITKVPRELVSFANHGDGTGTGELYFLAPMLSNAENTHFYIYFNSTSTEANDGPGVWSNGYAGVWHMETNASYTDSTGNLGLTTMTPQPNLVPGVIGNGWQFTGSQYLSAGAGSVTWGTGYEVTAWFTPASDSSPAMSLVSGVNGASGFDVTVAPTADQIRVTHYAGGGYAYADVLPTYDIIAGTPGLYGILVNNTTAYIYYNGSSVSDGNTIAAAIPSIANLFLAHSGFGASNLNGVLDELRISSIYRGYGWHMTESNNMRLQTSFIIQGIVETR